MYLAYRYSQFPLEGPKHKPFTLTMRNVPVREVPVFLKISVVVASGRPESRVGTATIKLWPLKCNGNNGSPETSVLAMALNCQNKLTRWMLTGYRQPMQ